MGILTGTRHSDAANDLLDFYQEKANELEQSGQYFMAAIALAFGLESAILSYLLVEFTDENGGELQIPDRVNFGKLIEAAKEIDILSAPINIPSTVSDGCQQPKYVADEVVDKIRNFRNLIHPAVALREKYDPRSFSKNDLQDFKDKYESVTHSLLYNL